MLTIRDAQMSLLAREARRRFTERLCVALADSPLDAARELTARDLRQRVEEAVEHAAALGLRAEASVAAFVALSLSLGPRFVDLPAVREALAGPPASLDARLLQFAVDTSPEAWAAIHRDAQVMPWEALDALPGGG